MARKKSAAIRYKDYIESVRDILIKAEDIKHSEEFKKFKNFVGATKFVTDYDMPTMGNRYDTKGLEDYINSGEQNNIEDREVKTEEELDDLL